MAGNVKRSKRLLAAILTVGMIGSTGISSVSAAENTMPEVVNVFQTFHGYSGNGGSDGSTMPKGWRADLSSNKSQRVEGFFDSGATGVGTTPTGSNIISMYDWCNNVYTFDEVIDSGKLHISFDMKASKDGNLNGGNPIARVALFDATYNRNTNDYWGPANNEGVSYQRFATLLTISAEENDKYNMLVKSNALNWNGNDLYNAEVNDQWHKYDFVVDFDAHTTDNQYNGICEIYLDGEKIADLPMTPATSYKGAKAFAIYDGTGRKIYLDNIYMHHYFEDTDSASIALDYSNNGILPDGGTVDVVFSEYVNVDEFWTDDFEVKNKVTGEVVEVSNVEAISSSGARLTLPSMSAGEYVVSVKNNELKGAITGASFSNSESFYVSGESVGDAPRYYIDEDFNNYKGGMPADFDAAQFTAYDSGFASLLTATDNGANGKAITVGDAENNKNIEYEFNNSIYSGKFTVEFDVKTNGNNWNVGIMSAGDFFEDYDYMDKTQYDTRVGQIMYKYFTDGIDNGTITGYTKDDWNTWAKENKDTKFAEWLTDEVNATNWENEKKGHISARKQKNLLIGNTEETNNGDVYSAKGKSETGTDKLDGAAIDGNTWAHVKTVVDLDEGTYNFYIGDSATPIELAYTQPTATADSYKDSRFSRDTLYNENSATNGKAPYKYIYGLKGIRLGGSGVSYDNVKVYTDKSYNDYLDFNGMINNVSQPGWYWGEKTGDNYKYQGHRPEFRINSSQGKIAQTDDKAMYITPKNDDNTSYYYVHPFAVPVKAGKSFEVEFDIKSTNTNSRGKWMFGLMEEEYMQQNGDNTLTTATAANGEVGKLVKNTQENNQFKYRGFIENMGGNTLGQLGVVRYGGNIYFGNEAVKDTNSSTITFADNQWSKVKISLAPYRDSQSDRAKLKISVTDATGNTVTSSELTMYDSSGYSKTARFYNKDTYGCVFMTNGDVTIDNLKVYEVGDTTKAAVDSIKTVNVKGERVDLGDTTDSETIEVNFNKAITSADGISLYYADGSVAPTYNVTLSENNTKATIELDEYTKNKDITLCVSNKTKVADSNLSAMETTSRTFKVTESEDKLEITDFRLYEKLTGREVSLGSSTKTVADMWAPVNENMGTKSFNELKLVVKGYNSGSAKDILMVTGEYDSSNTNLLSGSVFEKFDSVPAGKLENVEYSISGSADSTAKLRAFIWEQDTFKPLWTKLEYTRTPSNPTE